MRKDWLLHGEPIGEWMRERVHLPFYGWFIGHDWAKYIFAWGGMLFDLFIVPAIAWRKTRPFAIVACVFFHITNATFFEIGIFPPLMLVATTIFFEPDWPRRLAARFGKRFPEYPAATADRRPARLLLTVLWIHVALQMTLPLRPWLYGGDECWHEYGLFFSWHMMLRTVTGFAAFMVSDPVTGERWDVKPSDFLLHTQYNRMKRSPERIRQFAHFLANKYSEGRPRRVQVRAEAIISMNLRRPQRIVDPTVDLAAQPASLLIPKWIVPLKEPFPEKIIPPEQYFKSMRLYPETE